MISSQYTQQGHRSRRNRTGSNSLLGSNDGNPHRTFRTDTRFTSHFGNNRKYGIGHMPRSGKEGKEISHQRTQQRDALRMATQDFLRPFHHQIQSSGSLHATGSCNHCHNHQHHINRRSGGFKTKDKSKYGQPQASKDSQTDAANTRSDNNCQ